MNPKYIEGIIQALTDQRNAALNQLAQLSAELSVANDKIKSLEEDKIKEEHLP
jgi:hypothetical protein